MPYKGDLIDLTSEPDEDIELPPISTFSPLIDTRHSSPDSIGSLTPQLPGNQHVGDHRTYRGSSEVKRRYQSKVAVSPIRSDRGLSTSTASPGVEGISEEDEPVRPHSTKRKLSDRSPARRISTAALDLGHAVRSEENATNPSFSVRLPPRLYPDTAFCSTPREDEVTEARAIQNLLATSEVDADIVLNNFCVYWTFRDRRHHGLELPELVSLQDVFLNPSERYYFDGHLQLGGRKFFVRKVPFTIITIGAFEDLGSHTVGDELWIASERGMKANMYYRLGKPLPEYERFHEPYIWVASLAKHVVDYLKVHKKIGIHHFRSEFSQWLQRHHGHDAEYREWLAKYGDTDFRRMIACHTNLLRSQVETLGGHYARHPLWSELICCKIPKFPLLSNGIPKTMVTPLVYAAFKQMWFGNMLKEQAPSDSTNREFSAPWPKSQRFTTRSLRSNQGFDGKVQPGDVVVIKPDDAEVTNWKRDTETQWYLYVQNIKETKKGRQLCCLWLYAPSQTTLNNAIYLCKSELFLSNHQQHIPESDVLEIVPVTFFSWSSLKQALFVRQCYDVDDSSFRTLAESDLQHRLIRHPRREYHAGETVLVTGLKDDLLEPVVLLESTSDQARVRARRLLRVGEYSSTAAANELIYSDIVVSLSYSNIERTCHVRFYDPKTGIAAPYSRNGSGNCFLLSRRAQGRETEALDGTPADVTAGFDPQRPSEQLNGLDLFCGCGNFAQLVAEAGAVRTRWAVDLNEVALHSYYANTRSPEEVDCFCGSVDDYLLGALRGQNNAPKYGQVHFIIAGSPCQGFSSLNQHKNKPKSLKNISLVASTASYVDFYRPKYVLLENVVAMARTDPASGQNVFSQCLATFVSFGYQVQCFNLDACAEGAPQSRSRLIIALTAPGLTRLDLDLSHKYTKEMRSRSLGVAPNGLPFGTRDLEAPRPFPFVSFSQACVDLPPNQDGKSPCIQFPDHRPPVYTPYVVFSSIACIPRGLPGLQSLATARARGLIPQYLIDAQPRYWRNPNKTKRSSKAYARTNASGLTTTIIASFGPADAHNGRIIHWSEDRPFTIEEARRAQQFPTESVLLGTSQQRWRQVGNSVPGGLALALGVALRCAVDKNSAYDGSLGIRSVEQATQSLDTVEEHRPQSSQLTTQADALPGQTSIKLGEEMFDSSPPQSPRLIDRSTTKAGRAKTLTRIGSRHNVLQQPEPVTPVSMQPERRVRSGFRALEEDGDDDVIYVETRATSTANRTSNVTMKSSNRWESELGYSEDDIDTFETDRTPAVDHPELMSRELQIPRDQGSESCHPVVSTGADSDSDDDVILIDDFEDTVWAARKSL